MKIFKLKTFVRFAEREGISDKSLLKALSEILAGKADANLGGGLYKQRVAREGKGKSGGYRIILCLRIGEKAFFLMGFAKSDRNNLTIGELKILKDQSKQLFSISDVDLMFMVQDGLLQKMKEE